MQSLYSIFINLFEKLLPVLGIFSKKLKDFHLNRRNLIENLELKIGDDDRIIWFHAASLGEYEQGLPIIEEVKNHFVEHKIILTFFSPSGYEVKKDNAIADITTYIPLDTVENAELFISTIRPEMAIFVKYEFWPNMLLALKRAQVNTILISGVFRKSQPFFKWYGKWMAERLTAFDYFFVQDENSLHRLAELGYHNCTLSGDTRFDRVSNQLLVDNEIPIITQFVKQANCLVCGSTWPEDEEVFIDFINNKSKALNVKVIIAPHQINEEKIKKIIAHLESQTIRFTEIENAISANSEVLILDCIGLLSKVYSYADVAYVGGAVGSTGLHNVLEPATFGVPIITGTHLNKFPEALELQKAGALFPVKDSKSCTKVLEQMFTDQNFREKSQKAASNYITENQGATSLIMEYVKDQTLFPR